MEKLPEYEECENRSNPLENFICNQEIAGIEEGVKWRKELLDAINYCLDEQTKCIRATIDNTYNPKVILKDAIKHIKSETILHLLNKQDELAIKFAEWIQENNWQATDNNINKWKNDSKHIPMSTDEMLGEFKKQHKTES